MVWDVVEIICIMKCEGNRGIYFGVIVGVDLIFWFGLVFLIFLIVIFLVIYVEWYIEGYYEIWDFEIRRWILFIDFDLFEMRVFVRKISGFL